MSDTVKKATWRDLILPCRRYYEKHAAGGNLHIVLDDENIEDHNVEFCLERAREEKDFEGEELAECILALPMRQRRQLVKHYELYRYGATDAM